LEPRGGRELGSFELDHGPKGVQVTLLIALLQCAGVQPPTGCGYVAYPPYYSRGVPRKYPNQGSIRPQMGSAILS
jgi:hypothetical protein